MNKFFVPYLKDINAWQDDRLKYPGGMGGLGKRSADKLNTIVIHHTVTKPTKNARKDLDNLFNGEKNETNMIPYHFVITSEVVKDSNGIDYAIASYTGDVESIRAHAPNKYGVSTRSPKGLGNTYFIGISFIGSFINDRPFDAQLRTANLLCQELINENAWLPLIKSWNDVVGHKEVGKTACPGTWWPSKKNMLITPPNTTVITKPDVDPLTNLRAEIQALQAVKNVLEIEIRELKKSNELLLDKIDSLQTTIDKQEIVYRRLQRKHQEVKKELDNQDFKYHLQKILKYTKEFLKKS